MKKLIFMLMITLCFFGCKEVIEPEPDPKEAEPPFTGFDNLTKAEEFLSDSYFSTWKGTYADDPVALSVKLNRADLVELFRLIERFGRYTAVDLYYCSEITIFDIPMFNITNYTVSITLPKATTVIDNNIFSSRTNLR